ncbi:ABC transporter permease [Natrialba asiatica]|uniref:ABC transporter integral membrane subunit n=1 Tax=Natrialba asiatica (strain ATCC 700177 / DSM 12278 / JCM 9576 / FERM P-10747 / NBRC 102637 / 172P1) TaxID=29540 RepID=M0B7E3_NATA1|nr:ABC transporter permease [Natrialba asiatica]ELZ05539.1 ABC transporter integral membrane subunit [Natrialba asiatica DSM 12278]
MSERTESLRAIDDGDAFEAVADKTMSRRERYRRLFDRWVLAPGRIIRGDVRARIGASILLLYALVGLFGPRLYTEPEVNQGPRSITPLSEGLTHPLGTDNLGRDILAQIIHATPSMLQMIVAGGLFVTVLGVTVGTTAGFSGGRTDRVLSLLTDIVMTIPGLPLIVILAALLEPQDPVVTGLVLTINVWAGLAREIRSQVLSISRHSYVEASQAMGLSTPTIIVKDILPNIMPYVLITFVNAARQVIFASIGLYFLGVLPYDSVVNWGVMIDQAVSGGAMHVMSLAHWLIAPLAAITLLSFGLILFSQGTDRMFNPRVRARHSSTTDTADEPADETTTTTGGGIR